MRKFYLKILFLFSTTLTAQNFLGFRISRELSNFYWDGFLNYSFSKNSYEFFLSERFSELIIRTGGKFIRDDNDFKLAFYKGISKFKIAFLFNSISFADDKLTGLSRASSNEVLFGGKIHPLPKLGFSTLVGYKLDYQMGQKDKGWTYVLSLDTTELVISNYHFMANLSHSEDFISPRKNITSSFNLAIARKFTQDVESKVAFLVKRVKHDFYFYADSNLQRMYKVNFNIENRDEKLMAGQVTLAYPLFKNLILNLNFSANGRGISKLIRYKASTLYDSDIEEFILNTSAGFFYESDKLRVGFAINYVERNEAHIPQKHHLLSEQSFFRIKQNEEQKNNHSLRRGLNGEISWNISDRINIGGMFYLSLFRYDTPSSLNDDDRDEVLQIFRIFLRIRLSRETKIEIPLDLNNQHLVYIFSTKSVNNSWNRVIKLSPMVIFETESIKNRANFSVLANYTVYDFETLTSSIKSYVFRQFYLSDSLYFPIFSRISFEGDLQLIFSESGKMKWKEFKEKPVLFISTREYKLRLNYSIGKNGKFSIGYRSFEEIRYRFVELSKIFNSKITASGLVCGIEFGNQKFKLSCDGWLEKLRFNDRLSDVPNLNLNLTFSL